MTDVDRELLARARDLRPRDPDVRGAWQYIVHAIEIGWIDRQELNEILSILRAGEDYGIDELMFEHRADDLLHVGFLDDDWPCSPSLLIEALEALADDGTQDLEP